METCMFLCFHVNSTKTGFHPKPPFPPSHCMYIHVVMVKVLHSLFATKSTCIGYSHVLHPFCTCVASHHVPPAFFYISVTSSAP